MTDLKILTEASLDLIEELKAEQVKQANLAESHRKKGNTLWMAHCLLSCDIIEKSIERLKAQIISQSFDI